MIAALDPFDVLKFYVRASVLMMLLALMIPVTLLTLLAWSLVRCVKEQPEEDRLMWVLIIILVPFIGPILYFSIGRPAVRSVKPSAHRPPPPVTHRTPSAPAGPPVDLSVLQDEKQRAASINAALAAMSKTSRR